MGKQTISANLTEPEIRECYVSPPTWISPLSLFTLLPLVTLVVTFFLPNYIWRDYWKTPLFLTGKDWFYLATAVFVFVVGSRGFRKSTLSVRVALNSKTVKFLNRASNFLFTATLAIYLLWFLVAVSKGLRPETFFAILRGDNSALLLAKYIYFQKISGITTWVQLGIPGAALSALMFRVSAERRKHLLRMIILCFLAIFRTLFMAEREAFIETSFAVILMLIMIRNSPEVRVRIRFWQVFVGFWSGLLVIFGSFEFIRSWSSYYSGVTNDFFGFLVSRLLGYYATALNNAALANDSLGWQSNLSTLIHVNLFSSNDAISETLLNSANLEFNNISGLLLPFGALGFFGAIVLVFLVSRGFLALFASSSEGNLGSILAYSCSAISILEISRFFYLGDGRYLPVLLVLIYFSLRYRSLTRV